MKPYIPIDCEFHDRLEDAAVRKKPVTIEFWNDKIQETTEDIILDIRTQDGAEVLILESKSEPIRLDSLISLDEVKL